VAVFAFEHDKEVAAGNSGAAPAVTVTQYVQNTEAQKPQDADSSSPGFWSVAGVAVLTLLTGLVAGFLVFISWEGLVSDLAAIIVMVAIAGAHTFPYGSHAGLGGDFGDSVRSNRILCQRVRRLAKIVHPTAQGAGVDPDDRDVGVLVTNPTSLRMRRPKSSAFTAFQPSAAPTGVTTLIHKKKREDSERSANLTEHRSLPGTCWAPQTICADFYMVINHFRQDTFAVRSQRQSSEGGTVDAHSQQNHRRCHELRRGGWVNVGGSSGRRPGHTTSGRGGAG
jgi:hypothetical protein